MQPSFSRLGFFNFCAKPTSAQKLKILHKKQGNLHKKAGFSGYYCAKPTLCILDKH
jgi:hypothetical protein